MSFNPAETPTFNSLSNPSRLGTSLWDRPGETGAYSPLLIIWAAYGLSAIEPEVGVRFNLQTTQANANSSQISGIRGCYIDNTDSDVAVSVYFPDSNFVFACPPYSTAQGPVITGDVRGVVIGQSGSVNNPSQTRVFFTNYPLSPNVSSQLNFDYPQWRCSPQTERGLNQFTNGYTSPAIGDQWQNVTQTLNGMSALTRIPLFGTPYTAGGWITLTNLQIKLFTTGSVGFPNASLTNEIHSSGLGGTFFKSFIGAAAAGSFGPYSYFDQSAMQVKLNAAESWYWDLTPSTNLGANVYLMSFFAAYSYQGAGGGNPLPQDYGLMAAAIIDTASLTAGVNYGGLRFTAPATAALLRGQFYCRAASGAGNTAHCELWTTGGGGSPALKVAQSSTVTIAPSFTGTVDFPFLTTPPLNNGQIYWLVLVMETNAAVWFLCADDASFESGRAASIATLAAGQIGAKDWNAGIVYQP